ncbi:uncharacterized protein AKAME5_000452900 [Lates japonicus]|uniref:Uncharacterized protein n=1 Tax=Lates japonicus TaxID=270547 RepID=A0AAD3MD75_LATJO|nr:uncharacterized protein AKAME5_000452900 [Lates japonicus]
MQSELSEMSSERRWWLKDILKVLSNTEETQLRSSREDEVDPEQHQEILKEEAKENQLSLDTLCSAADVSALETSGEEQPTEQQQTCLSTEEDRSGESSLSKDLDVDVNDGPITDAKDKIVCSSELKVIVTSAEDNIPETETPEVRDLGETSNPDLEETETKTSSDDFRETCNKFSEEQENKQEDADESKLSNTESCPQQKAAKDVIEENLPHGTNLAVSNSEPQQEPENAEEAENGEAEEISSKSQGATASGKKKKKKRRGKKKGGNQQKDSTEKEHSKTEEDIESAKRDNGSTEEPAVDNSVTETLKESKTDQVKNEQDSHKTKEVDAAKAVETFAHKEALKEPRMDPVTNEHDKKQMDLETETEEELKVVAPTETLSHIETPMEIRVDHVTNEPSKDQSLERETVEKVEAVATAETFSHVETLKELTTEPTEDEQNKEQTLEGEKVEKVDSITNPPEASLSAFDLIDTSNNTGSTDDLDKECTCIVDNSVSGDISTNGEVIHSESEIIDHVEDEAGPVNEMKPECTATNPENSLQTNIEENTEAESNVPSNGDIAADESESTNDPERKDLPPYTDDFTEVKSSSVSEPELETESKPISEPVSELSVTSDGAPSEVSDRGPKDATETITDVEEPEVETEQEYLPPSVVSPSHDGGNSELEQEGTQKEELSRDSKEPEDLVEPDSSSHDEKIDSASSLTKNTDASDAEKSPMETVAQVELLDDGESQTLECVEQSNESNTKVSSETDETNITDVLNTPDSPKEATEIGISIEQDHSTEVSAVEDLEYEMSQNEQESDTSLCPLAEQLHESSKDKPKDDSSQPTKEDSDEEDAEDEEGQSFDFDDMDIEAAVGTNSPQNQEQEDVEEGVEVMSNESNKGGSDPCQSNTETNENTQNKPIESNDEKRSVDEGDQVDTLDKKSDTVPQDNQNSLAHEESTADGTRHITEEGKVLNVGESGVAENINQATSLLVEEGLDAIEHSDNLVLPKSGDQVASNKETPQTGKEVKKNGRKGKGKGKEECKMS